MHLVTDKVGIGTSSPSNKLHVIDDASTGIRSQSQSAQATDTNKALHVSNGNLTDTFNVSYKGQGYFAGNVGIGTASPASTLELSSADPRLTIRDTDASTRYTQLRNTAGNTYLSNISSGSIIFGAPDEKMRITDSGNVGIGTSSPGSLLNIRLDNSTAYAATDDGGQSANTATLLIQNENGTNNSFSQIVFDTAGSNQSVARIVAIRTASGSNDLAFVTEGSNTKREVMRLASSGNVGIGTASPDRQLVVNGTQFNPMRVQSSQVAAKIEFQASSTSQKDTVAIGANNNDFVVQTNTSGVGTTRLTVKDDGNVGIGTASPSEKLSVSGNGTFTGTVSAQGSVLTSDQRFKENITDANAQLADVTALGNSLRNWDWTADAPVADKDTRFLGLVAQEAETICPGIVTTIARAKDGDELTPEVVVPAVYETRTVPAVLDEEGEVIEPETTEQVLVTEEQVTPATYEQLDDSYKGIKNDILVMKLLGAVAELSAKVETLEQRLSEAGIA